MTEQQTYEAGTPVWYAPAVLGYGYHYPGRGIPAVALGRATPRRVYIRFRTADTHEVVTRAVSPKMLKLREVPYHETAQGVLGG